MSAAAVSHGGRTPTPAELDRRLPWDSRALLADVVLWGVCVAGAFVVSSVVLEPRDSSPLLAGVALVWALALQVVACVLASRYWPWAAKESMRFAGAAALGFAVGIVGLSLGAQVTVLHWVGAVACAVVALAGQYGLRWFWLRRAHARWVRDFWG